MFGKGIKMFFLIPVEIVDSGDFLFDLFFDEEDFFFWEAFSNGLILFSEHSNIFLIVKSKDK